MIKLHELFDLGFTPEEVIVFKNISDIYDVPKKMREGSMHLSTIDKIENGIVYLKPDQLHNEIEELSHPLEECYGVVYYDVEDKTTGFYTIDIMEYLYSPNLIKMDEHSINFFLYALVPGFLVFFPDQVNYMLAKALVPEYNNR